MTSPKKKTERDDRDDIMVSVKAAAILGGLFTLGAFGTYDSRTAMSVGLGAAIAVANLLTMRAIVRALLPVSESEEEGEADGQTDHRAAGKRGGTAWGVFALFKMVILFGGIWFLLTKGLVAPIPLVVGYGVLPLGIAASSLSTALAPRGRRKK